MRFYVNVRDQSPDVWRKIFNRGKYFTLDFLGLAILTRGPVAFVIAALTITLFLLSQKLEEFARKNQT